MPKKSALVILIFLLTTLILNGSLPTAYSSSPSQSQPTTVNPQSLPPLPGGLKPYFITGLANQPGSIGWMTGSGVSWDARYQYLAGGVNTGYGWSTWNTPAGQFANYYMDDSYTNNYLPVFTYYMMLQSNPAVGNTEPTKDYNNLTNNSTMYAYYADFKLLMDRAKLFNKPVIVHVEPDLWGYLQQKGPSSTVASVTSSGYFGANSSLPNTVAGFAQALIYLRNTYAPNVMLAYHISPWASPAGDLASSHAVNFDVQGAAQTTANFYQSLNANFDLLFYDIADRDAAYYSSIGDPNRWWDTTNATYPNFNRFQQFASSITTITGKRGMLWQVPIGNTLYRSMNNTPHHWQDNRVQYYLGDTTNQHIRDLANAGLTGILFGAGDGQTTSYNDAANDGITNPNPINGNNLVASYSDDDGGNLRLMAKAYYQRGAVFFIPNAPDNLVANALPSGTQINLTWRSNSTDETGFAIEAKAGPGGNWAQIATVGAGVATYPATGLLNGTPYYFQVRAYNANGYSFYSTAASATTTFPAPSALVATASASTRVNLTWADNSNSETGFQIERSPNGTTWTQIGTAGPNATTFVDNTVQQDTLYYYRVRAINTYNQSSYATLAVGISTPPSEPSNLQAVATSGTQINLTWADNSSSEQGFHLDRKIGLNGSWQWLSGAVIGANALGYNDTGLTAGTLYYYGLRSYKASADSANSNEASAITLTGLVVTSNSDGGTFAAGTLSKAINDIAGANNIITFALTGNNIITVSGSLPNVPIGATIGGACGPSGPSIIISGSGGQKLRLSGNNTVFGVQIGSGVRLELLPGTLNNHFVCTRVIK